MTKKQFVRPQLSPATTLTQMQESGPAIEQKNQP